MNQIQTDSDDTQTTVTMSGDEKIDVASPYYLGSGDQLGNLITHVILTGDNYVAWARAITLSLKARRKFLFVDGTIAKPAAARSMLNSCMFHAPLIGSPLSGLFVISKVLQAKVFCFAHSVTCPSRPGVTPIGLVVR